MKFPQLKDENWLRDHYVAQGLSTIQIASIVGCSSANVQLRLHQFGIESHSRYSKRWTAKGCERCGVSFTPTGPAQRFCSDRCRLGTRPCEECGKDMLATVAQVHKTTKYERRFCSSDCRVEWMRKNSTHRYATNGYILIPRTPTLTRDVTSEGYVRVSVGRGYSTRSDGRILEHRYVMQELLGRPLSPNETVHHINGDTKDNRPENLQLRNGKHGTGAHFRCGDCGSHNIVAVPI